MQTTIVLYSIAVAIITVTLLVIGGKLMDKYCESPIMTLLLSIGGALIFISLLYLAQSKFVMHRAAKAVEVASWHR